MMLRPVGVLRCYTSADGGRQHDDGTTLGDDKKRRQRRNNTCAIISLRYILVVAV